MGSLVDLRAAGRKRFVGGVFLFVPFWLGACSTDSTSPDDTAVAATTVSDPSGSGGAPGSSGVAAPVAVPSNPSLGGAPSIPPSSAASSNGGAPTMTGSGGSGGQLNNGIAGAAPSGLGGDGTSIAGSSAGGALSTAGGAGSSGDAGSAAGGLAGNGGSSAGGAAGGMGPTLTSLSCGETWNNPAMGDTWAHDPSLTREGNVYYLFSTPAPVEPPLVRELVHFKRSTDGVTWTNLGGVFPEILPWWDDDIPLPETWAGEIRKIDDTYYLYYSISAWFNFSSSIGLATNTTLDPESPTYEWVDQGKVIDFENGGADVNVIDPTLFIEDDGRRWLVYGSFRSGLRLTELDPATGKLLTDPPNLTVLTNGLGEGSSLIRHENYYYLLFSTGSCCAGLASTYHVGMGRSENIEGPYLTRDNQRVLDGAYTTLVSGDADHPGLGGQSFYQENGQLYMVYHAYTAPSGDSLINVRPIFFDAEGWPTLDPCLAAP